jgi:hypothetical protein
MVMWMPAMLTMRDLNGPDEAQDSMTTLQRPPVPPLLKQLHRMTYSVQQCTHIILRRVTHREREHFDPILTVVSNQSFDLLGSPSLDPAHTDRTCPD